MTRHVQCPRGADVDEAVCPHLHRDLPWLVACGGGRVIRRREIEEPHGELARVGVAAGHDRRAHGVRRQPIGADVPGVRLAAALADHGSIGFEREAPAVLDQCEGGRDLDQQQGGDTHPRHRRSEKARMQPQQRWHHHTEGDRFETMVERDPIESAAQATRPEKGRNRQHAPQHRWSRSYRSLGYGAGSSLNSTLSSSSVITALPAKRPSMYTSMRDSSPALLYLYNLPFERVPLLNSPCCEMRSCLS